MARDGRCRAQSWGLGPCAGPTEWAHVGPWKRYLTRGLSPEERHCRRGSVAMCDRHHDMYDANVFALESADGAWAEGNLKVVDRDGNPVHQETRVQVI